MQTVAALDCGTNSTRLLIVDSSGTVLAREMRITRLGQGVDATQRLAPEAIARTVAVLTSYRQMMDATGVERSRLVATSAARDAENGDDFLSQASEAVGTRAELLSGTEEGELSYAGATTGLAPAEGDDVVLDIGGGSTEFIVSRDQRIGAYSTQLGCVRLSERYLRDDPPTTAEVADLVLAVAAELELAFAAVPALAELRPGSRLIGLAGTVSTLSMLNQALSTYDRDRVHHSVLSLADVQHWCDVLASEPAADRRLRPGMVEGRQDVIVGGALILREAMQRLGVAECLVSESDILDGLVASMTSN
jgi:exopolyphosphatase/guanosine-5'-triphosphate,3'-diphosphate pyrophosphatase